MRFTTTAIFILLILFFTPVQGKTLQDSIEVYIIESYVAPEEPQIYNLSFFTSAPCKSTALINNEHEITITDEFTEDHSINLDLTGIVTSTTKFTCIVFTEAEDGSVSRSERLDVELPADFVVKESGHYLFTCITGGIFFLTPSISYINRNGEPYFGLNKEIPFLSFRGGGFSNTAGYLSFEYQHIFDVPDKKNILRLGYKHIFPVPVFEYVSPGVTGFSDLQGYNGIGAELSVGLVKLYNFFTIYLRGRYNFQPGEENRDFSEITLGLHTSFFTFKF